MKLIQKLFPFAKKELKCKFCKIDLSKYGRNIDGCCNIDCLTAFIIVEDYKKH